MMLMSAVHYERVVHHWMLGEPSFVLFHRTCAYIGCASCSCTLAARESRTLGELRCRDRAAIMPLHQVPARAVYRRQEVLAALLPGLISAWPQPWSAQTDASASYSTERREPPHLERLPRHLHPLERKMFHGYLPGQKKRESGEHSGPAELLEL